jgi:hypothetical protein
VPTQVKELKNKNSVNYLVEVWNTYIFTKNYRIFYLKIATKLSKIWFGMLDPDPKSGIRKKTYSGSGIPDPQATALHF